MGVTTVTQEFPIPRVALPSQRQHPKTFSEGIIKSMDLVEGQWDTPGSVMKVTYADGYEKYKIVASDHANKCFKNTLIEGGVVGEKVDSVDVEMKFLDGSMKITSTYHTKGDAKLTQAEINAEENKAKLLGQNTANQLQAMAN